MSEPTEKLIYWRTQNDVAEANLLGQYNSNDLNRVESWCRYLADELNARGYSINITTKTNWTQYNLRDQYNMNRIRSNIKAIMDGFHYLTQISNNVNNWDWQKANNWEKILYEIYILMHGMTNWYVYCGVANGGQPRLWQHRFRDYHNLLDLDVNWNYLSDYYRDVWNEFNNSDTWESVT